MLPSHSWLAFALLVQFALATSYVSSFSDASCTQLFNEWDGPNGYPNGSCTSIRTKAQGQVTSFMITGLDEGCTVTLYANDGTDICTPNASTFLADVETCYNSSWAFYSIDWCTLGGTSYIRPSASDSDDNKAIVGAIAGGLVGGVALLALILMLPLYFCMIRPRRTLVREQQAALQAYRQQLQQSVSPGQSDAPSATEAWVEIGPGQLKHELPVTTKAEPVELSGPFDRNMSDEEKGLHMR
ncbi:uncharacterized protein BKCO1_4600016 [Diplodia corticola]|uniref:Uncharacterized protein n=1 Tax=Diplodia corticola TaxID=236234 RepID=A0A1J9RUP3_9PEZI|nr:uncharacterized protein BKCO1_4600016 [Diplodia corticola]OJD31572.1 hypothetical protein BKCO1_4600016 [Diplodia corticola]